MAKEKKLPWSFKRTLALFKAFFTGIVPEIAQHVIDKREKDWNELPNDDARREHIAWTKDRSIRRRNSMYETASRGSFLLVGMSLFTGVCAGGIFNAELAGAGETWILIGLALILIATIGLWLNIGAKGKVMKRPRLEGDSEADERLAKMVAVYKAEAQQAGAKLRQEYDDSAKQLHKRKIILTVERRAQWVCIIIASGGAIAMLIGLVVR